VTFRIFFSKPHSSHPRRFTLPEFRAIPLVSIIKSLEFQEDINAQRDVFSYKHFYVIYCKFWELDTDHDMLIGSGLPPMIDYPKCPHVKLHSNFPHSHHSTSSLTTSVPNSTSTSISAFTSSNSTATATTTTTSTTNPIDQCDHLSCSQRIRQCSVPISGGGSSMRVSQLQSSSNSFISNTTTISNVSDHYSFNQYMMETVTGTSYPFHSTSHSSNLTGGLKRYDRGGITTRVIRRIVEGWGLGKCKVFLSTTLMNRHSLEIKHDHHSMESINIATTITPSPPNVNTVGSGEPLMTYQDFICKVSNFRKMRILVKIIMFLFLFFFRCNEKKLFFK